jgi:S-formylglutathione hydrolase FrmB
VVLPQQTEEQIGVDGGGSDGPPPLLYLLHGLSDDHTAWNRYTAVARHAEKAGLAVVMPAVSRSFYTNEAHGLRYWDYVSEELPAVVHEFFRVTSEPSQTFVAGLSMGGYGALKLAFSHPERYAAAASLSGGLDLRSLLVPPDPRGLLDRVFGGSVGDEHDLFTLLDRATDVPPLYLGCGTEDPLLPGTRKLAAAAAARGIDVTLDLRPGTHEWSLWDAVIADVIAWLPLDRGAAAPR